MEGFEQHQAVVIQALVEQVRQVIHLLNPDLVREYKEALEYDAHLVERETVIQHYLHVEDYHPLAAARRIALRWKLRKELFGGERWLLPMTGFGAGAISPLYVEFLRTGCDAYLFPPQGSEGGGGEPLNTDPIYLVNRARLPPQATTEPVEFIIQISFYMTTIFAEEVARRGGRSRVLLVIQSDSTQMINPTTRLPLVHQFMKSMPIKMVSANVARTYEPGREYLCDYLAYRQQSLAQMSCQPVLNQVGILSADSFRGTLNLLLAQGYHRQCLPMSLGGDLDYNIYAAEWVRRQISLEGAMTAAPPVRNAEVASQATRVGGTTNTATTIDGAAATTGATVLDSMSSSPSASASMHHRNVQMQADPHGDGRYGKLGEPRNDMVEENYQEEEDDDDGSDKKPSAASNKSSMNAPFASTAASAPSSAASLIVERQANETEQEFLRRRSRIYAKRSNDKLRRQEKEVVQQVDDLESGNQALRADNRRLESLLAMARQVVAVHEASVLTGSI